MQFDPAGDRIAAQQRPVDEPRQQVPGTVTDKPAGAHNASTADRGTAPRPANTASSPYRCRAEDSR